MEDISLHIFINPISLINLSQNKQQEAGRKKNRGSQFNDSVFLLGGLQYIQLAVKFSAYIYKNSQEYSHNPDPIVSQ